MARMYLEKQYKIKLIEILLIIGTIFAAFNLSPTLQLLLMYFVVVALLYYIMITSGVKETDRLLRASAIATSCFFAGILSSNIGLGMIRSNSSDVFALLMTILYYVIIVPVLYIALTKSKNPSPIF